MHVQKISDDLGRVSAAGEVVPEAAGEMATVALAMARNERVKVLLVDFTGLRLSRPLSTSENYELGRHLARVGSEFHRVAFVTPGHCIEPHKFTIAVAANRGLTAAAFTSEAEALRWLQAA